MSGVLEGNFPRKVNGEVAEKIFEVLERYGERLNLSEAVGILELVKLQLIAEQSQP